MNNDRERRKGVICAVTALLCYATTPTMLKLAYGTGMTTNTLLFDRFALSLLLGLGLAIVRKRSFRFSRPQIKILLLVGFISALSNLAFNEAYRYLPGAVATVISLSYAIFVLIMELLLSRQQPRKDNLSVIAIAAAGLLLIAQPGSLGGGVDQRALGLGVCASFLYAIQIIAINTEEMKKIHTEVLFVCTTIPIVLVSGCASLAGGDPLLPADGKQLLFVVVLALVNVFAARLAFFNAVRLIGASQASMIDMLEPLVSGAAGFLILGELLSGWTVTGTALILLAILLSSGLMKVLKSRIKRDEKE